MFQLSSTPKDNGFTHVIFDYGPAQRVQFLTLTEQAHLVHDISADKLFESTLTKLQRSGDNRENI